MSEVVMQRRGLVAVCLALGAVDLAFIDAVALPRVMAARSAGVAVGTSLVEAPPPPTPPAPRAESPTPALLPRAAGEAGRGSPATSDRQLATNDRPPATEDRPPASIPTPSLALTIHFTTGDASLDGHARAAIDALAAQSVRHRGWTFTVNGHADARGEDGFNAKLSGQRAAAVVARLEGAGVPRSQLRAAAFGSTRPLATGDDPRSLRRNRRVEILIARGAP
jgi:outer membrane protein OmpA-like peptidoglycan-associated protein